MSLLDTNKSWAEEVEEALTASAATGNVFSWFDGFLQDITESFVYTLHTKGLIIVCVNIRPQSNQRKN